MARRARRAIELSAVLTPGRMGDGATPAVNSAAEALWICANSPLSWPVYTVNAASHATALAPPTLHASTGDLAQPPSYNGLGLIPLIGTVASNRAVYGVDSDTEGAAQQMVASHRTRRLGQFLLPPIGGTKAFKGAGYSLKRRS